MSYCRGESSSGNIMSQHSIYMAHAKRISRSVRCIAAFSVTENTTQGWTERGRRERLKRWVWRTSETKLSWLLVSWMCLVLQITPGLEFIPATLMCSDLRDYESFPKGFSLNFLQLIIYLKTCVYLFGRAEVFLKKVFATKQSDLNLMWFNFRHKYCCKILAEDFPPSCVFFFPPSAVVEWDSDALFKGRKGSGKDNSFIPVFITKHKFYIKSLSKGSLTLFPFPMLN